MKTDRDIGKIGISLASVTRLGNGRWAVEYSAGGGPVSVVWDADDPDIGPVVFPDGSVAYIDNHGEVVDLIGATAFVRIVRADAS